MNGNSKSITDEQTRAAKARFGKLDQARVERYMGTRPGVRSVELIGDISYPSEGAGASNGIAFLKARIRSDDGVRERELVIRFDPGIRLLRQKSYSDEYHTIRAADRAGLPVPNVFWLDPDGDELGTPGFFMDRIEGDTPAAAMYSAGPLAKASPEQRKAMMLDAARFHGRLRKLAIGEAEVPHLLRRGQGGTPLERELNWWLEEVRQSAEKGEPQRTLLEEVHRWLIDNRPKALRPATLVHGDSQVANMIFRDGKIVAVLDWELSHLGYGELDIYFLSFITEFMKVVDRNIEGTPSQEEYIAAYEEASGTRVEFWEYFRVFQHLRNCAVLLSARNTFPNFASQWEIYERDMKAVWRAAS